MMIVYASLGVAIVCFILYALDRRSKNEPIAWEQAAKLSSLGGIITGGVVFATTATDLTETVTEAVKEMVPAAEEMFVGVPTF